MNIRTAARAVIVSFAFSTTLFGSLPARAEVTASARAEIDHLLTYVGNSGCEFYRNGSWYDGKKGQSHLSDKFNYLIGSNMIQTASDFIDKAATQSSLSGQAYKVRCNGAEPVESARWLGDELARFRDGASKTATIASRPVTITHITATGPAPSPLPAKAAMKVN